MARWLQLLNSTKGSMKLKNMRTTAEVRAIPSCEEEGIRVRSKRNKANLPNAWDDIRARKARSDHYKNKRWDRRNAKKGKYGTGNPTPKGGKFLAHFRPNHAQTSSQTFWQAKEQGKKEVEGRIVPIHLSSFFKRWTMEKLACLAMDLFIAVIRGMGKQPIPFFFL